MLLLHRDRDGCTPGAVMSVSERAMVSATTSYGCKEHVEVITLKSKTIEAR